MSYPYQNFQTNVPQFQNMSYAQQPNQYPYMDRVSQFQTMNVQQPQLGNTNQFVTLGKVVESIDIVKATDIPMDGNMYYFPKADGKEVYAKQWLPNGTTNIIIFKPELKDEVLNDKSFEQNEIENFKITLNNIKSDLQTLNDKIDKISKPINNRSKRENNQEE